ncbi:MAG: hypothetical protein WDO14_04205 [Bacteroidota bacterium]
MRLIPLTILALLIVFAGHAQSPPGINYQGIARNTDGKPISQKDISIKINIVKGNNGDVEYAEIHSVKTNAFGLFTLVIGEGQVQSGEFQFISWAIGNKWLRVEMDPDGGSAFKLMGSQQFMSVPYAFYSRYSGSSPLSAGQGITIVDNKINVDLSGLPASGASQDLKLTGNTLGLTNSSATVDLTAYKDNTDAQTLAASNSGTTRTISITGGNSIAIDVADNDNNSTNEIQDLSLTGNTLTLSNDATSVSLAPYLDNTDNQDLKLAGNILSLTNDATPVDLAPYLDNTDAQTVALSGTTLSIVNGNSVSLAGLMDNTDSQDLSLTGNVLSLTGDATPVSLAPYLDNTDNQNLSALTSGNNRTVNISGGTGVTFSVADGDSDSANEIQLLNYNSATKNLSLSLGNTVTIPETQNIANVLTVGNDAGGQKITNLGAPTATTDATSKQYVDAADNALTARISANYAFKANYSYSSLLALSEVTMTMSTKSFDDFNVVGSSNFTAPVPGTYMFIIGGTASGLGGAVNISYNGTKYPVPLGNGAYNGTFMFRLAAGETVSVVATSIGIGTNINGSFYGYKLL